MRNQSPAQFLDAARRISVPVGGPDPRTELIPRGETLKAMASYYRRKMSDKDYYLSMAKRPNSTKKFSKYRGVTKANKPGKYRSVLTYKGQRHYLGEFYSEIEAAQAYNNAALRIIGEHALINDFSEIQTNTHNSVQSHDSTRLPSEANGELHDKEH